MKRYDEEPGTETVDSIIEGDTTIVITSLSVIEAVSAFRRKQNTDDIPQAAVDGLIGAFFREALAEFVVLPLHDAQSWSASRGFDGSDQPNQSSAVAGAPISISPASSSRSTSRAASTMFAIFP